MPNGNAQWHRGFYAESKSVAPQSETGPLAGLQLQLEFVCDQGDEIGI